MVRVRQHAAAPEQPIRRRRAANVETLRSAAEDFLSRFGSLVDEVVALREAVAQSQAENDQLRAELAEALDLFRDAGALVARTGPATRARGRAATRAQAAPARVRTASTGGGGAARSARASAHGRATPASVTRDVVRAVIGKLGNATAAEIAAEIGRAGAPVSGRAIRHIAKAAGAVMRRGDDGRMVYSLS